MVNQIKDIFSQIRTKIPHPIDDQISDLISYASYQTKHDYRSLISVLNSIDEGLQSLENAELINFDSQGFSIEGLYIKGNSDFGLIFLHGNGCFYQTSFDRPLQLFEELKKDNITPHLLVFNPRGTGRSLGTFTPEGISYDVLYAFEMLLEQGVNPNKVAIVGHSQGGFFASIGAKRIQEKYKSCLIHCISDRSFSSLKDRLEISLNQTSSQKSSKLKKAIISKAFEIFRWNQNPIQALETLKGLKCIIFHPLDEIVDLKSSIYAKLIQDVTDISAYNILKMQTTDCDTLGETTNHIRQFQKEELQWVVSLLKKIHDL